VCIQEKKRVDADDDDKKGINMYRKRKRQDE
jgi:hypothetical protein